MRLQRTNRPLVLLSVCVILLFNACSRKEAAPRPAEKAHITVNWDKTVIVSKTSATLQAGALTLLPRGSALSNRVNQELSDLGCNFFRTGPAWYCYPKRAIAEMEPPKDGKTSWDFSLMDPEMEDAMKLATGHTIIINFSTIPEWMFKTEKPVPYPADPDRVDWDYEQGTELRDPSMKEVADYYARLAGWYTKGGFTDEFAKFHKSSHSYKFDYWEVLNEPDLEHKMTPETYTKIYDAVVAAVRKVQPQMKFVAIALAFPMDELRYFEYFFDPKNHKPGTPIDMVSYHFYATPGADESPEVQQYTVFDQADGFLRAVRDVELFRQRFSPKTLTDLDELGCIPADDLTEIFKTPGAPAHRPIPNSYWNLCGAMYAYLYGELASMGIDVATESQLVGFPGQFPGVTMVDWNTGQPNARYWVLKLLHDNFGPGNKLVETHLDITGVLSDPSQSSYVYAQAFVTPQGQRKILLVNKRDRNFDLSIPGGDGSEVTYVDQTTGFEPPATARLNGDQMALRGLAVAIVSIPK